MIKSKYLNKIMIVLLIISLVFVVGITYSPETMSRKQEGAIPMEYESKLFNKDEVMTIDIQIDESKWNEMLENASAEEYVVCDITINGVTYKNVGIRPKGNTSLSQIVSDDTTDRYSFKIEFDRYIKSQTCYGLDQLVLNNIMSDTTYMKEYLAYDLLSYMGVPSSLYAYASITRNGEPWGLYLALEGYKESFAQRNFGTSYGNLYKPESTNMGGAIGNKDKTNMNRPDTEDGREIQLDKNKQNTTSEEVNDTNRGQKMFGSGNSNGCDLVYTDDEIDSYSAIWESSVFDTSKTDYMRVITALKNIKEGNLVDYMDVDLMLRYIAVNSVIVNYDSYFGSLQHNYYLYEKDGVLSMLPWDYNLAFAGFGQNDATSAVNDPIDTPVSGTTLEERPFVGKVLETEAYKNQYHDYLNQLVEGYFQSGQWLDTIAKVDSLISDYVKKDETAFYTYEEYQKGVETLREFGLLRASSIKGQLENTIPSTEEGQSAQKNLLIDGSHLSISAMGTQGGGENEMQGMAGESDTPPSQSVAGEGGTPPSQQGAAQGEPPSGMHMVDASKKVQDDIAGIALAMGSIIIVVLGIVIVSRYKRKKYWV